MKGIFHVGPAMLPLFHTYLTKRLRRAIARRIDLGRTHIDRMLLA